MIDHLDLGGCAISAVNYSEVAAKLAERGVGGDEVRLALDRFQLDVRPFDVERALRAGLLAPSTRSFGLSLGDRACIGLGLELGTAVLTADRAWQSLSLPVEVILVR